MNQIILRKFRIGLMFRALAIACLMSAAGCAYRSEGAGAVDSIFLKNVEKSAQRQGGNKSGIVYHGFYIPLLFNFSRGYVHLDPPPGRAQNNASDEPPGGRDVQVSRYVHALTWLLWLDYMIDARAAYEQSLQQAMSARRGQPAPPAGVQYGFVAPRIVFRLLGLGLVWYQHNYNGEGRAGVLWGCFGWKSYPDRWGAPVLFWYPLW